MDAMTIASYLVVGALAWLSVLLLMGCMALAQEREHGAAMTSLALGVASWATTAGVAHWLL
jgi:hypothetical protein